MNYFKRFLPIFCILAFQLSDVRASNEVKSTVFVEALFDSNKFNASVIKGKIIDKVTGEVLIGATAIISGTVKGGAANVDGEFTIRGVSAGDHILVVSYLGYQRKEIPITVVDGDDLDITIELIPQSLEGEEITVTAQARGQISAINEQRSSNTITNIVSKDRIEELPDVNAAESVGRLPGVSLQRSGGEANKVVIRGLSPKYNNVTVNGVKLPSTDTNNRSVDLSLVSSNMLDGIEVTKAATPDKDADALGGTVDLKLRNADKGFSGDFQVQGGYTALQETYDNYKVVGSLGNRFFDNKLGIIVNGNADRYDRSADNFNGSYGLRDFGQGNVVVVNGITLNENINERSRLGGSVVLDYKIPNGKVQFNSIYNELKNESIGRNNNLNYSGGVHSYTLTEGSNTTSILASGISFEQDYGWMQIEAGYSINTSNSESPEDLSWNFREQNAVNLSGEPDTLQPQEISALFKNDLSNTLLNTVENRYRETKENEQGLNIDVKIPIQVSNTISGYFKTGGKFRRLERENDINLITTGGILTSGNGRGYRLAIADTYPELGIVDAESQVTLAPFISDNSLRNDFLNGDYSLGYPIRFDLMRDLARLAADERYSFSSIQGSESDDYTGSEEYNAFYAMTEFELGKYITLLSGLRYEKEQTTYTGKFIPAGRDPAPGSTDPPLEFPDTTATRDQDFFLPMIQMQIKPAQWVNLRLAYTHTISRPDFRQFAPITRYTPTSNYGIAGNTQLKTARSRNYDASISFFQNKLGFFTVSGFYKEIDDLVWGTNLRLVPGQQIVPGLMIPGQTGAPLVGTNVNIFEPAIVKGFEIDWQTNFWYLPSYLSGLVLNINYTRLDSEVKYPTFGIAEEPIQPTPSRPPFTRTVVTDTSFASTLPDQPSDILNLTVGYDLKGFSGRVSFLFQAKTTTGNFGRPEESGDDIFVDDYFRIDVSVRQKIIYGLQLYANLSNLNNRKDVRLQSQTDLYPTSQQYYGFTMDIGLRYKF
tara:strand:- start:1671 stop:4652 length:2982 start_codon:yes stop_codon:yes gene_type:complete